MTNDFESGRPTGNSEISHKRTETLSFEGSLWFVIEKTESQVILQRRIRNPDDSEKDLLQNVGMSLNSYNERKEAARAKQASALSQWAVARSEAASTRDQATRMEPEPDFSVKEGEINPRANQKITVIDPYPHENTRKR